MGSAHSTKIRQTNAGLIYAIFDVDSPALERQYTTVSALAQTTFTAIHPKTRVCARASVNSILGQHRRRLPRLFAISKFNDNTSITVAT